MTLQTRLRKRTAQLMTRSPYVGAMAVALLGGRIATASWLRRHKASDTLYVLGSGSSICDLTKRHWDEIERGDSIGLNSWILHRFVPTFYSGEFPREGPAREVMVRNLRRAAGRYRDTAAFFRLRNVEVLQLMAPIRQFGARIAIQEVVGARSPSDLQWRLRELNLTARGHPPRLLHQGSSVDTSAFLSFLLGYRRVVFCGVDLTSTDYFYDLNPGAVVRGYEIPPNAQLGFVHKSNDPSQTPSGVTVSVVLGELGRLPGAPSFAVANPDSALHPALPVHRWETR